MSRTDIVGYTLAEIALLLLFAITAVFFPTYSRLSSKLKVEKSVSKKSSAEVESLKNTISELQAKPGTPKTPHDAFGLRSKQLPSCIEKGSATTWLFSATATSSNTYLVNGEMMNRDQIKSRFASPLELAEEQQCRQSIQLFYAPSISLPDYDLALRKMEGLFYVTRLGPNRSLGNN
jgi:hypothetical protein